MCYKDKKPAIVIKIIILILLYGCEMKDQSDISEKYKNEIMKVEKEFENMVKDRGMADAFLQFASEEAVLFRNNELIKGKEEIKVFVSKQSLKNVQLEWTPEHVDVSKSGDLAYTYGNYSFSAVSPNGDTVISEGIFHTVWKRQENGDWKYVWD